MAIVNSSKPSTTLANTTRVSFAELWSTITTTWASETRTWKATGSLLTNTAKKLLGDFTFDEVDEPMQVVYGSGRQKRQRKPKFYGPVKSSRSCK